ncbi:glycosyltransferase family 1 protein [Bacillus sp. B15-48]|uniref:glycosyltransferase family 4 protein n=1 Tax=Bacillus sp. B15-48 TaxID=1548601 RepID=UPI00193FCCEB|nr:glycosyltransferase family 1 protein [Bacillus sp. B15-48]MBM4763024.1 glycosyltransferase [Bacillus sp. B15-48]
MKIAIFTDTFYPDINGVARTLKRFTDYLHANNHSVKVFAPTASSGEYVSTHIHRFKSLSFILYPECRLAFPNVFSIKDELEQFKPDIIHVATPFNMGLSGVYYANKLNIPLVGSYHTDFNQYLQYYNLQFLAKFLWKYMYWFHKSFKKTFVPSIETLEQLKMNEFSNLEVWPRGVDCQLFHPFYDQYSVRQKYKIRKPYILSYVGRLAPEKDVHILLDVAKSLPLHIAENVQWMIVGDGPLREIVEKEAPPSMMFTGYLQGQELAEIYSVSDLFVFPSPTETFGNVALESLASGTPVIGANSGGVKSIIKNGFTGRLCEPGDVAAFTNAVCEVLMNDHLRTSMGIEARNYALTQKWETIFENLLGHYRMVVEENMGAVLPPS